MRTGKSVAVAGRRASCTYVNHGVLYYVMETLGFRRVVLREDAVILYIIGFPSDFNIGDTKLKSSKYVIPETTISFSVYLYSYTSKPSVSKCLVIG